MSDASEIFFTAVGCMDGRVQDPIAEFGRKRFDALFADTITEAGLVGKLGNGAVDPVLEESLKLKIMEISAGRHNSKGVVVHGHQECAGNPVDDQTHKENIRAAAEYIKSLVPNLSVILVFVFRKKNAWEVEPI